MELSGFCLHQAIWRAVVLWVHVCGGGQLRDPGVAPVRPSRPPSPALLDGVADRLRNLCQLLHPSLHRRFSLVHRRMRAGPLRQSDRYLHSPAQEAQHAPAAVVRAHRIFHLAGREHQYFFRRLALSEPDRRLGNRSHWQMEFMVPAGHHDLHHRRQFNLELIDLRLQIGNLRFQGFEVGAAGSDHQEGIDESLCHSCCLIPSCQNPTETYWNVAHARFAMDFLPIASERTRELRGAFRCQFYTYSVLPSKITPTLPPCKQNPSPKLPSTRLYGVCITRSMDLTLHRQEIAKGLLTLESAIERLIDALSHRPVTAIVDGTNGKGRRVRRICDAFSTIDYGMEDDVIVCLGVVGVNAETLKRAHAVNTAKANFKALCTPLQGIRIRIPIKGESSPAKAIPAIRGILRKLQRSDLNLLGAARRIPILDAPPATVTSPRANTRAVYRKTVDEIAHMLSNIASSAPIAARERLAALDHRITHLALVRYRYENIRANVLYAGLDPKGR